MAANGASRTLAATALVLGLLAGWAPATQAHDFPVLDAVVVLKSDGTWHADLRVDVDALALGVSSSTDSAELAATLAALDDEALARARRNAANTLSRRIRVRFDDRVVRPTVAFPSPEPTVFGTLARFEGIVPEGAASVSFFASRSFGTVRLTVLDQAGPAGRTWFLDAGARSEPYRIGTGPESGSGPRAPTFATYLGLGFEHILPKGLDHILFVLGLFLLGRGWKPLLVQVSAFTLAHTATLALAMLGWVRLPSSVVEPLIALSIAWVAIENLWTDRVHAWRPAVVFGFGLLHGLGFAGVLEDLGLPSGGFASALVGFNVGVEFGQLAVVGLAFLAVGWWRERDWYRHRIVIPACVVIACVGLYWAVERALL
jgi:hypothetical protein